MSWECACGIENRDNATKCVGCGTQLSEQAEAVAKKAVVKKITQSTQIFREWERTNVIFMVLFTLITAGMYIPIWFLRRRSAINNLKSSKKLGYAVFIGMILLMIIDLTLAVIGDRQLDPVSSIIGLLLGGAYYIKIFKVQSILNEHYNSYLEEMSPISEKIYPVSGWYTFLFGIFYLQYKINNL